MVVVVVGHHERVETSVYFRDVSGKWTEGKAREVMNEGSFECRRKTNGSMTEWMWKREAEGEWEREKWTLDKDGNTIVGQIKRGHSTVVERDKWIKKTEGRREREGKEKTGGWKSGDWGDWGDWETGLPKGWKTVVPLRSKGWGFKSQQCGFDHLSCRLLSIPLTRRSYGGGGGCLT